MAYSLTKEEKKEYFDSTSELDKKCEKLAAWILASDHFTCFTGAGISTATGIPDFRSSKETVLETGPGCWEVKDHGLKDQPVTYVESEKAIPSYSHMALVELIRQNHLKYLISQNTDGIHRKSGIPRDHISELHGNT